MVLREADLSFWIADDTVWSCTTCGACNDVCPVGIEVFNKIVDLRRGRVEAGHVPDAAEELFESSAPPPAWRKGRDPRGYGYGEGRRMGQDREACTVVSAAPDTLT